MGNKKMERTREENHAREKQQGHSQRRRRKTQTRKLIALVRKIAHDGLGLPPEPSSPQTRRCILVETVCYHEDADDSADKVNCSLCVDPVRLVPGDNTGVSTAGLDEDARGGVGRLTSSSSYSSCRRIALQSTFRKSWHATSVAGPAGQARACLGPWACPSWATGAC